MPVEAANNRERSTDPEIAVKIDHAGNGHVRLIISGGPGQVGIAKQDRLAWFWAAGGERPRVRTLVSTGFFALGIFRRSWPLGSRGRVEPGNERPDLSDRGRRNLECRDVMAVKIRRHARRELLGVKL